MGQTLTSPARGASLDERSFEQLLAAAFVIQEHNKRLAKPQSIAFDFTKAVSAISTLQEQVAAGSLDLPASARLIAERALLVTSATGAAVGIVVDESLTYIGAAGTAANDAGRRFSIPDSLPASCILTSETLQFSNSANSSLPRAFAGRSDLRSFIAVPVIQKGTVLGVFELRFSESRSFSNEELRTAELFAGVVNLAITTAAKKHAAGNGDSLPRPEPIAFAADPAVALDHHPAPPIPSGILPPADDPQTSITAHCSNCGSALASHEFFCGRCGVSQEDANSVPPTKEATITHNSALEVEPAAAEVSEPRRFDDLKELPFSYAGDDAPLEFSLPVQDAVQDDKIVTELDSDPTESNALVPAESLRIVPAENPVPEETAAIEQVYPWSSAQKAREWFEGLRAQQPPGLQGLRDLWESQRANIWLGASALILLFAIVQFSTSPSASQPTAGANTKAAAPQLSFFESLLVSLGMAEAPPAVVYAGNPEARVWVDVRTALYYCSGTSQYGKTPGGKFTSQKDAQQDQFEPAHRKVCP